VYTTLEVNRGVSAVRLIRHFEKAPGGFAVKQVLKTKVQWRNENLLRASHAASKFDIVLCRNVLIYFDAHDREIALGHLIDSTTDGGYIGLGTSETFLKPQVAPGWYRHSKTKESSSR
jgi:chemotaxis protein methyltransferase CheR